MCITNINEKNIGVNTILKNIKMTYKKSNLKFASFVGNLLLRPAQVSSKIFLIPTYLSKPEPLLVALINCETV